MRARRNPVGFTVIELLVVMALIALTLTLVAPQFIHRSDRARESVLRNNLAETRKAIDRFLADNGRYPENLQELVDRRYLRALPIDPILERTDRWVLVPPGSARPASAPTPATPADPKAPASKANGAMPAPPAAPAAPAGAMSGVADLRSGAHGQASDGTSYGSW